MTQPLLLVEPDEATCRALREGFQRAGYTVHCEADGDLAAERLEQLRPQALIFELMLPGSSGFELAARARRLAPPAELPLLALSDVYASASNRRDAVQRFGLLDLLAKPLAPAEVVDTFERLRRQAPPPWPGAAEAQAPRDRENTQPDIAPPRPAPAPEPGRRSLPPVAQRLPDLRTLTPLAPALAARVVPGPGPRAAGAEGSPRPASAAGSAEHPLPPMGAHATPVEALPIELQRGDLVSTPLPALLHGLHRHGATGALYLRHERKKKVIYFLQGSPRQVKSNLLQECLGRILLREGLIAQDELDRSVEEMKTQQRLQGEVLLSMGLISERGLRQGLQRQIERKLFDLFAWSEGSYRFQAEAEPPGAEVQLTQPFCQLLREGVLRFYPGRRVREEIDAIAARNPVWSSNEELREQPMGLSPDEEAFFALLDGYRSADQVLRESGLSREHAERLLLALLYVRKAELAPAPQPGQA